jgi:HAD superfamily hydrolase (TIGR01509 family)
MIPQLVIFDCDGVLVDSEGISDGLLVADLNAYGLSLATTQVGDMFVGGTIRGVGESARAMGAALPESWVDDFYEKMYARLAEGTPLIDGIIRVLERLDDAKIPYRVVSNGSERKMQITLGQHPELWLRLKDKLFSAHTFGAPKPNPKLMFLAAASVNATPTQCVAIDDSATGCTAGVRAGMRVLGFAAHDDGARLKAVGAEVFHDMRNLPKLLGL